MHETSLIDFTLNAIEEKARPMGISKVKEIGLVIGKLAAVPELMESAFRIMKYSRDMFRQTSLHIDCREISFQCLDCGRGFESDTYARALCPDCGGNHLELTGGQELLIDYFVPDEEDCPDALDRVAEGEVSKDE